VDGSLSPKKTSPAYRGMGQ